MTLVTRVADFDVWRPGYAGDSVSVVLAGTNTLASIYSDYLLTIPVANPVILLSKTDPNDATLTYGKFAAPIYVGVPYQLVIGSVDATGVVYPPITSLTGLDASLAKVLPTGAVVSSTLADLHARHVDVRDFGAFLPVSSGGASAATNNSTLMLAVGAVAAQGGGFVDIPDGTYQITSLTLPQGVILRGGGRGATTLQSNNAGNVITIGGTRSGLYKLTLDGITLVGASVGVYAANQKDFVLDDTEVKRFETGLWRRGGTQCDWRLLFISNCVTGAKLYGDTASAAGGALRFNIWRGGQVDTCSTAGIELKSVDTLVDHNEFIAVTFSLNTGTAVVLTGARASYFYDCQWSGNIGNLIVNDGSPLTATNSVVGIEFIGGEMDLGTLTFSGTYTAVAFRRMVLQQIAVTINAPGQNILVEDCSVASPTISGVQTSWLYHTTNKNSGASFIVTSDGNAHKAWGMALADNQYVYLEARVIARQQNGITFAFLIFLNIAHRPAASLPYSAQTVAFTVGKIVTGATSGATARIVANSGSVLSLQDVSGTFVANEIISDTSAGSATAGTFSQGVTLVGTPVGQFTLNGSGYTAVFAGNGGSVELNVTGAGGVTLEWSVDVKVVSEQGSPIVLATGQTPPYTFTYHFQAGLFVVGGVIAGSTSGATGTISALSGVNGNGGAGSITVINKSGTFQAGEIVTEGSASATIIQAP